MTEIDRIVRMLKQTFEGEPYYGPSVLGALQSVTASVAAKKPVWSAHTIWDIVAHLTAELIYAREVIEGGAGPWDETLTWPEVTDTSTVAWERAIQDLEEANRAFVRAVQTLDDAMLDQNPVRVRGPYYLMLHGTLQHNVYHAGQISLLTGQMRPSSDILDHNRRAWDRRVELENEWTVPVSAETVAAARRGQWQIVLTPTKPVPRIWFPDLTDLPVLCLASGGGQQGPLLAAAGAKVTVFDNSPGQLAQDRLVAERESLDLVTVQGDMADLSVFPDESFGLIIHPVSNCFVPDVRPVWAEAYRVLQSGGVLLTGFVNPAVYLFDDELVGTTGVLQVTHTLPYAEGADLSEEERQTWIAQGWPFEFSHTLEDQIGGQLAVGFVLTGFYEDVTGDEEDDPLSRYMSTFIATRAVKP